MNTLMVLLDGAEDHPIPEFGGERPMDVAEMPFFDSVTRRKGYTTGREYTHIFLNEMFTGHPPELSRAAIEALGLNMRLGAGRTAYRLSPAYLRNGMVDWAYDMEKKHTSLMTCVYDNMKILDEFDPDIKFFLNGRAILTMDCNDIPDLPMPPVPAPYVNVPGKLGIFVNKIANDMNGLTVYPWGCGRFSKQHDVLHKMDDLFAVSDSPTALGISASMGHRYKLVRNIDERFPIAYEELRRSNVFLHMDEVDEYSHQKDPVKKVKILEHIDRMMEKYFDDCERILYFVDHGTSSITGEHILMKVPFWTTYDIPLKKDEEVALNKMLPTVMDL